MLKETLLPISRAIQLLEEDLARADRNFENCNHQLDKETIEMQAVEGL